ncbi:hypothetical protein C0Z18_31425 [Trinickia dabaoshanensis]|uniref:Uncharacterized protein n=1 Tax=Trinickia dabaoshanensis TaxID=564714 RepID=A0A2N7VBC7_9BURK|nr:hypothetical protein [Trinickia dabaoshanensis]PMS14466.1 hypothetical protein C0Z18_31425 [Trinickia dabaoshanensis]
MNIGSLLEFPEGYRGIPKSAKLHLLDNFHSPTWTFLVEFIDAKEKRAVIRRIARPDFESGLLEHAICVSGTQPSLPPWLVSLEGIDLQSIEAARGRGKHSNVDRVTARLCEIQPLLSRVEQIFCSGDPSRAIAALARVFAPRSHPNRLCLWFACYRVFGSERALYPSYIRIGHWDRKSISACKPLGLPPRGGRGTYFHVDDNARRTIENGYAKCMDIGSKWPEVYVKILKNDFNCTTVGKGEELRIVSRDSNPFPTINQVTYCTRKAYSPGLRSEAIYGASRVRQRLAPDQGRYSRGVANVFERAEADGYFRKDRLRDFAGRPSDKKFCVVRLVDVLSGVIAGVGFAWGSETADAYRMALFCASIRKAEFARLFGLEISDEDWPCIGLPAHLSIDRGPGAAQTVLGDDRYIGWRELTASFSPMDKASVESSHPRTVRTEGRPIKFQSTLTPVDAAKDEILRAIKDNWSSDASERLTPDMIELNNPPNPMSIWEWLDKRGRTSAELISSDEAVRTFLTPVEFKATRDSLRLDARSFASQELEAAGFRQRLPRSQTLKVPGYAMNLCVRHAWVKVDHRLIPVDAQLPIRDDDAQLYSTTLHLAAEVQQLAAMRSDQRERAIGEELKYQQACEAATGKDPTAGTWASAKGKRRGKSRIQSNAERDALTPRATP